jgi:integrase/recombinase XerD
VYDRKVVISEEKAMPKENRKGQATSLSSSQIDRIIELASPRYKPIFAIAGYTGCRISEVLKLEAKRLDLPGRSITFVKTKTKTDRTVPISPKLEKVLESAQLPSEGFLFPGTGDEGHVVRTSAADELKKIADDLGLVGVSTHSFRRSLATNLSDSGVPLKTIASVTGHRSLDSLSKYIDVTPTQQMKAVALL